MNQVFRGGNMCCQRRITDEKDINEEAHGITESCWVNENHN